MLNHIVIMGRFTKDPELRYTQNNTAVASFTIACDRDYSGGGERQCDFINCTSWRNTAEFVSKYFHKGSMAVVNGRLQSRQYEDRDGKKHTAWEVLAENVYFGESKKSESDASDFKPAGPVGKPTTAFQELADDDGDLPF